MIHVVSDMEGSSEGSQYLEESGGQAAVDGENNSNVEAKVLDWEEYQEALARFCGLGSLYIKARVKREALKEKLEAAIEVHQVLPSNTKSFFYMH